MGHFNVFLLLGWFSLAHIPMGEVYHSAIVHVQYRVAQAAWYTSPMGKTLLFFGLHIDLGKYYFLIKLVLFNLANQN